MSIRSMRTLAQKLRGLERKADPLIARVIRETTMYARGAFDPSRKPQGQRTVMNGMDDAREKCRLIGVQLADAMLAECVKALTRDMRAIESNAGRAYDGLTNTVLDDLNVGTFRDTAYQLMQDGMDRAWLHAKQEMDRQWLLARRYDSDPGIVWKRLFSFDKVRKQGRSGIGVIPSMESVVAGVFVGIMYPVMNEMRLHAFDKIENVMAHVG